MNVVMSSASAPDRAKVREIFQEALDKPAGPQRQAYLEGACRGDASLRNQVEALLKGHREDSFLEKPAVELADTVATPRGSESEIAGTHIGRYKLLQKIGEGGCGVVYMAEQFEPVR